MSNCSLDNPFQLRLRLISFIKYIYKRQNLLLYIVCKNWTLKTNAISEGIIYLTQILFPHNYSLWNFFPKNVQNKDLISNSLLTKIWVVRWIELRVDQYIMECFLFEYILGYLVRRERTNQTFC